MPHVPNFLISVIQVREDLALDVAGLPTAVLSFENVLTFFHNNPPVGCSSRNLLYFTWLVNPLLTAYLTALRNSI